MSDIQEPRAPRRESSSAAGAAEVPEDEGQRPAATAPRPKTAVLLIHGMGEQRPMATLWGFVEALWSTDRDLVSEFHAQVYAKPDTINDNFELRRVTTRHWEGDPKRRVDFFEFYWAHLMRGNTIRSTVGWIVSLFIRSPSSVPDGLRTVWLVGLLLLVLSALVFGAAFLPKELKQEFLGETPLLLIAGASLIGSMFASKWLAPVAGDAARYLSPDPENVEARQKIMRAGVGVLERLTASGEYDRIIVVGHSLGSAIGLDILNQSFGRVAPNQWAVAHAPGSAAAQALSAVERAAGHLLVERPGRQSRHAYRTAQRAYAAALQAGWQDGTAQWLVTDFVTLGSPLSKAGVLLARTPGEFEVIKERREVPSCPPKLETRRPPRFAYAGQAGGRVPHHGAIFGPTVLTNVYFSNRLLVMGDIIAGRLSPQLGPGVLDVELPIGGLGFRHNSYWNLGPGQAHRIPVDALRRAVNLRLRSEVELWTGSGQTEVLHAAELCSLPVRKGAAHTPRAERAEEQV